MASDNREQIIKDIDALSLEKYLDEIAGASLDGISRCKTERDVWSAVEVCPSYLHHILNSSSSDPLCTSSAVSHRIYFEAGLITIFRFGCPISS